MKINLPANPAAARIIAVMTGSAGSFVLFAAYAVIPALGFLAGLLAPFPALYVTLRFGRLTGASVTIVAAAAFLWLSGSDVASFYLLQCSVTAHLMPELLLRGFSIARAMLWTTAVYILVFAVAAFSFSYTSGINLHLAAQKEINESITQALAIYGKSGVKGEDLEALKNSLSSAALLIEKIYPALITVMLVLMAGLNLALFKRFAADRVTGVKCEEFSSFRMPENIIWVLIAAGFSLLSSNPVVNTPALNILIILLVFYFLQGMAVLLSMTARVAYPAVIRAGLYLMLLFQPYLTAFVALLGVFDLWGDFRAPKKQENL